jgi:nitrogen fixation NifU-like protein
MYSAEVLDHFQNPHGVGDLQDAAAVAEVQNPICGDVLRLAIAVEGSRITAMRFRAKGCVPAIACGSKLVELMSGSAIEDAGQLEPHQIIESLQGLPPASEHAASLAVEALRMAVRKYESSRR